MRDQDLDMRLINKKQEEKRKWNRKNAENSSMISSTP